MNLNNIELPDFIIAELYKDSLLATEKEARTAEEKTQPPGLTERPEAPATRETPAIAAEPVITAGPPAARHPDPGAGYKFLGNNRQKITILVNSPGVAFLPDGQLAFLTKMLEACKMNVGDIAIVNQATSPVKIAGLKQQLQPSIFLLFGPEPVEIGLPINFPQFKIQAYDQCTYLCAPSLDELVRPTEESKLLKSKLWVCLKALFQI